MVRLLLQVLLVFVVCLLVAGNGIGQPPMFECVEDGTFVDYYRDCQVYYICKDGAKQTFGCAAGLRYSIKANACVPSEEVDCPYPA